MITALLLAAALSNWQRWSADDNLVIDIDQESINARYDNGWETLANIRLTPAKPVMVEGFLAFSYVESIKSVCKSNELVITKTAFYSKEGKLLYTQSNEVRMRDVGTVGSFIHTFVSVTCRETRNIKPPLMI